MTDKKTPRRQQILETLALELEKSPGKTITTAGLAKSVGVSEAALYRHFASKAKMYDALIEFMEESIFGFINRILDDEKSAIVRCEKILGLMLGFAQKNPGLTRLLTGDILIGETERLRKRIDKLFERLETQLKQVLREGQASKEFDANLPVSEQANLLMSVIQGRILQFVRSEFKILPLTYWDQQWPMLMLNLSDHA
ncbi:Transcriptional regulator SlmA, TetR family [hydrothermal vent metagenome]|uniref:Transcriptional regulator SlmA, TetR family n=1 Tax=hydrothermal vent metagenome TaxID=652676 RepID=A0A3B1A542_9ZZZZ